MGSASRQSKENMTVPTAITFCQLHRLVRGHRAEVFGPQTRQLRPAAFHGRSPEASEPRNRKNARTLILQMDRLAVRGRSAIS